MGEKIAVEIWQESDGDKHMDSIHPQKREGQDGQAPGHISPADKGLALSHIVRAFDLDRAESWTAIYLIVGAAVMLIGGLGFFLIEEKQGIKPQTKRVPPGRSPPEASGNPPAEARRPGWTGPRPYIPRR